MPLAHSRPERLVRSGSTPPSDAATKPGNAAAAPSPSGPTAWPRHVRERHRPFRPWRLPTLPSPRRAHSQHLRHPLAEIHPASVKAGIGRHALAPPIVQQGAPGLVADAVSREDLRDVIRVVVEALDAFMTKHSALPASVKLTDYDYLKPPLELEGSVAVERLTYWGRLIQSEVEKIRLLAESFDSVLERWSQKVIVHRSRPSCWGSRAPVRRSWRSTASSSSRCSAATDPRSSTRFARRSKLLGCTSPSSAPSTSRSSATG